MCREHRARDRNRLLKAYRTAEAFRADLEEYLIGDVVVRTVEELAENLGQRARLAVNVDRGKASGHGSGCDFAADDAAGLLDEGGKKLAGVLQARRGVLVQADAAAPLRPPRPKLTDRKLSERRLLLGGLDLVAAAHGVDGVEVHRERRVQGIEGLVGVLDAGNAKVGGKVARVEHDAGNRLLADRGDKF